MTQRFDYAVFRDDDAYVTNALLSVEEAAGMEARGFRLVRVRDTVGENLPAFRGQRSVRSERPFRRRYRRD